MAALVGKQLGEYQILEEIGRGGMAVVYKAYQPAQRRYVALKVLPPYFQHDPQLMARFLREGEAATALQHPNVVRVYEAGQAEGLYYLAMQYIDGQSLAQELARRQGALDILAALDIARQVGSALAYAHRHGVIHRDVKPSNILLSRDGRALLSDFGIAKAFGKKTITQPGALLGTPAYMSPEQGRGRRDLDARTDIYSLGIVLYEMLTGDVPFHGDDPTVVLRAVLDEQPVPPSRLNADVSPALGRVVLRAVAKEREQRHQTIGEMLAGLEAAGYAEPAGRRQAPELAGQGPPRVPHEAHPRGLGRARRGFLPLVATGAAAIVLLVLALVKCGAEPALPTATGTVARPGATAHEVVVATSTLISVTATPTGLPTPVRTGTPTAVPQRILAPAPVLLEPQDGANLGGESFTLRWSWTGTLGQDEYFDVRVWRETEAEQGIAWTKEMYREVSGLRSGKYFWRIVVIRHTGTKPDGEKVWEQVSEESEKRSFSYSPPSTPEEVNPKPPEP